MTTLTVAELAQQIEDSASAREPMDFVNPERTVLVVIHPNGSMSVALRDEPGDIWGPPMHVEWEG